MTSKFVELVEIWRAEAPAVLLPLAPNFRASLNALNLSQRQSVIVNGDGRWNKKNHKAVHLFFAISLVQKLELNWLSLSFLFTYLYIG